MKRQARKHKIEIPCWVGEAWDGNVESLLKHHVVPADYELSEVKRAGNKYTFVYLKSVPRSPK